MVAISVIATTKKITWRVGVEGRIKRKER